MSNQMYGWALLAVGMVAAESRGIVVSDAFDYAAGPLAGADGGVGWSGPWSDFSSSSTAITGSVEVTAGSVVFGDYATSGNKLTLTVSAASAFHEINARRSLGDSATSGDVWTSFLYQRSDGGTATASRAAEVRFFDTAINFGSQIKPANSTGIAVRYDASTGSTATSPGINLHDNSNPYLVITKYASLGTAGAAASMWVLDVAGYDAIKAGGILESELDAAALLKATDTTSGARDLSIGEQIRIVNATSATPFAFSIDELRVGDTLASIVPEPASALGLMASFILLNRSGRQRRV